MNNFWDYNVWGFMNLLAVLLLSLLAANMLKKWFSLLQKSLIPTSVLGGVILLIISGIYKAIFKAEMFDTNFFGGNGTATLEVITYHMLALGFIASTLKTSDKKLTKKRTGEIFDTGVTTVSSYLLQAIFGMLISLIVAMIVPSFFKAAGALLPFGYGQGTGQAMNYGGIYENEFGFEGGKSFGLSVAALGFISAALGGVFHLNLLRRRGKIDWKRSVEGKLRFEEIQSENEIPMQESIDKLTVQVAFILAAYLLSYLLMMGLGNVLPGMRSVIYGFNFLLGVLAATLIKLVLNFLTKRSIIKKTYTNNFLLTRTSNFFFDVMVVAGMAAIRLQVLARYWVVLLIMGIVGMIITYIYNRLVAVTLFKDYQEEQFLMMYGMLTGTASTGTILLRELDGDFKTPAAENMVYQNFPAIIFGFPMMLLATLAPVKPWLSLLIFIGFFTVMNVILFRRQIFLRKKR
ncbi:MAG: hypothetical protein J6P72_07290 [Firmicutes bacterium]|nr:hypothetical protein [Bacillota bacterium]